MRSDNLSISTNKHVQQNRNKERKKNTHTEKKKHGVKTEREQHCIPSDVVEVRSTALVFTHTHPCHKHTYTSTPEPRTGAERERCIIKGEKGGKGREVAWKASGQLFKERERHMLYFPPPPYSHCKSTSM
jgi:hypothetical protein